MLGHKKGPRFFIPRPLLGIDSVFFAYWNNKPKKRNMKTPAQKNRQRANSTRISLCFLMNERIDCMAWTNKGPAGERARHKKGHALKHAP